jgi:hypothetical protein
VVPLVGYCPSVIGRVIAIFLLLAVLSPLTVHAKRTAAPRVAPVTHAGVRYTAPNDNGRRAYIQAWDAGTGKKLWEVTVFRNFIKRWREECIQWVFIKQLQVEGGKLVVLAERDGVYRLDLKTRSVRKSKRTAPPERIGRATLESRR